jgi:hypothetical protein
MVAGSYLAVAQQPRCEEHLTVSAPIVSTRLFPTSA